MDRRLGSLFIVSVIDILGFGILIPLVPYMGVRFNAPPEWITPIMGSYSLCQLVAAPFWGRLSDRFGRRANVTFFAACCVATVLAYVFAPLSNAEYHTSEMILVITVIGGTGNLYFNLGNNTYTGGTTINSGTNVDPGSNSSFGTGTITVNNGTLTMNSALTFANNLVLNGNTSVIGNLASGTLNVGQQRHNGNLRLLELARIDNLPRRARRTTRGELDDGRASR